MGIPGGGLTSRLLFLRLLRLCGGLLVGTIRCLLCGRVWDRDSGIDTAEGVRGAPAKIHRQYAGLIHHDGGGKDTGICAKFKLYACPSGAQLKDQLVRLLRNLRFGTIRVRESCGTKAQGKAHSGQECHADPSFSRHGSLPLPQRMVDIWVMTPQIRLFS